MSRFVIKAFAGSPLALLLDYLPLYARLGDSRGIPRLIPDGTRRVRAQVWHPHTCLWPFFGSSRPRHPPPYLPPGSELHHTRTRLSFRDPMGTSKRGGQRRRPCSRPARMCRTAVSEGVSRTRSVQVADEDETVAPCRSAGGRRGRAEAVVPLVDAGIGASGDAQRRQPRLRPARVSWDGGARVAIGEDEVGWGCLTPW
jgi:hypothetical protein